MHAHTHAHTSPHAQPHPHNACSHVFTHTPITPFNAHTHLHTHSCSPSHALTLICSLTNTLILTQNTHALPPHTFSDFEERFLLPNSKTRSLSGHPILTGFHPFLGASLWKGKTSKEQRTAIGLAGRPQSVDHMGTLTVWLPAWCDCGKLSTSSLVLNLPNAVTH